jgi:hypothetical protein
MSIRRKYRKSKPYPQMYVVMNKDGEVFTGLLKGNISWSYDWSEAKPLFKESTTWLLREYSEAEIIKKEEIK